MIQSISIISVYFPSVLLPALDVADCEQDGTGRQFDCALAMAYGQERECLCTDSTLEG